MPCHEKHRIDVEERLGDWRIHRRHDVCACQHRLLRRRVEDILDGSNVVA